MSHAASQDTSPSTSHWSCKHCDWPSQEAHCSRCGPSSQRRLTFVSRRRSERDLWPVVKASPDKTPSPGRRLPTGSAEKGQITHLKSRRPCPRQLDLNRSCFGSPRSSGRQHRARSGAWRSRPKPAVAARWASTSSTGHSSQRSRVGSQSAKMAGGQAGTTVRCLRKRINEAVEQRDEAMRELEQCKWEAQALRQRIAERRERERVAC